MKKTKTIIWMSLVGLSLLQCDAESRPKAQEIPTQVRTPEVEALRERGGQEHGGGFAFWETSVRLLELAKTELANSVMDFEKRYLMEKRPVLPIDSLHLTQLIQTARKNYKGKKSRKNIISGEAVDEPLMFNWGTDKDGPYIEALELYFIAYMERKIDEDAIYRVKKRLLHEALHHFGYDEIQAKEHSERLMERGLGERPKNAGTKLKLSATYQSKITNNDGSVSFILPAVREYQGGIEIEFSRYSDPAGVCGLFGYRYSGGGILGETTVKGAIIDQNQKLKGYQFTTFYKIPESQEDAHVEVGRPFYLINCYGAFDLLEEPEQDFTRGLIPFPKDRAVKVVADKKGGIKIHQPFVRVDYQDGSHTKFPFLAGSDLGGVCQYYGYKEFVKGSDRWSAGKRKGFWQGVRAGKSGHLDSFEEGEIEKRKAPSRLTEIQCRKIDARWAAVRFVESDSDPSHHYGGEQTLEEGVSVLEDPVERKRFFYRYKKKIKENPDFLKALVKSGFDAKAFLEKKRYTLVVATYVDCDDIENYLAVDQFNGEVHYLFSHTAP